MRVLHRGWRVTLPNLEQTGLLVVDYPALAPLAAADQLWQTMGPLRDAENAPRIEVMRVLLDELRRVLVIDAEPLTVDFVDRIRGEGRDSHRLVGAVGERTGSRSRHRHPEFEPVGADQDTRFTCPGVARSADGDADTPAWATS